jgi:hypothetical protein
MRFAITAIVTIVIACILTLATNRAMAQTANSTGFIANR